MSGFSDKAEKLSQKYVKIDKIIRQKQQEISVEKHKKAEKERRKKYPDYRKIIHMQLCIKKFENKPCQFMVDGKVFCLEDKPCWRVNGEKT